MNFFLGGGAGRPQPAMPKADSCLYTQESFLTVHKGPYGMPLIKLRLAVYQASIFPSTLSLQL